MAESNWASWRLQEWNDALVRAVLLDPAHSGRRLQRVTASDRFLAQVAGAHGDRSDEAKSKFIRSFGSTASQVATHFQWTTGNQRSLTGGLPNFFGALYLTLLAGSADEDTYMQGNFRVRFATLLKDVSFPDYFTFSDLPQMWKALERWCRGQVDNGAACRRLILPDPQHETLIGYSKRLAFPSYRDESRLSTLLSGIGGIEDLTPAYVQQKVAQALGRFSDNFRQEYQEFATHYGHGRIGDAYETPFWGAVQDIAWDLDSSEAKKNGRYDLVVDVTDYFEPWLAVLADEVGCNKLGDNYIVVVGMPPSDDFRKVGPKGGGIWTPSSLRSLASKSAAFAGSRLGRAVASRQVIALPDELGQLSARGAYFDGCRVAFLTERARAERLFEIAKQHHFDVRLTPKSEGFGQDAILVFSRLDRKGIAWLKERTEDGIFDRLVSSQSSASLSLSGGAWLGQLLLLNPASAPVVRVEDMAEGAFEYLGRDGVTLSSGAMEQVSDSDGFRIPPLCAADVKEPTAVRITASNSIGRTFVKLIHGLPVLAEGRYIGLRDRSRWRIGGANGALTDLSTEGFLAVEPPRNGTRGRGNPALPSIIVDRLALRPPNAKPRPIVSSMPLDRLNNGVIWLWDALSLRFQNSQALPYREVLAHAEPAAKASSTSPYLLIRLLEVSGWLVRLASRKFRSVSFVPAPRELVLLSEAPVTIARLVGPLSSSAVGEISAFLLEGEELGMLLSPDFNLSCGAVLLKLNGQRRMSELAGRLGASLVAPRDIQRPLWPRGRLSITRTTRADAWRNMDGKLEEWRWNEWKWTDYTMQSSIADGSLIRHKDQNVLDYFVSFGQELLVTNCESWARWLTTAIRKGAIGDVLQGGELMLDEEVFQVPVSLSRWWMLVGGGSVAIGANGALCLTGQRTLYSGAALDDWVARENSASCIDIAMERRELALRLLRKRGRRYAMP